MYLLLASAWLPSCKRSSEATATRTAGVEVPFPVARAAYVTDNGSDTVSVIDRDGDRVVHAPVDVDPKAHEAPHHLAIDPAHGRLFVALAFPDPAPPPNPSDPHAAHGNAEVHGKLARLTLPRLAMDAIVDVDENPGDVILTPDRGEVLVTHFDMRRAMRVAAAGGATSAMFAQVQAWSADHMTPVASRPLCVAPHGMTATRDGKALFVACYGSDELAIVDLGSPTLATTRVPLGANPGVPGAPTYGPYSATLSLDETRVVVADLESMDLRVFDRASRTFVAGVAPSLGARAFMPAFVAPREVLVPLQGPDGLARVNVDTGAVVARVATGDACRAPHVARVARDGRVYVVCEGDHVGPGAVVQVDPASLAITKRWTVGVYPDGIVFGDE